MINKAYNFNNKIALDNMTATTDKENRRYTALSAIYNYDIVKAKYNDKKSKLVAYIATTNLFEVFFGKDYHICTKIDLTKLNKNAKYHDKWDMKYDIRVNTVKELQEVVDYIIAEYNKYVEEYNNRVA